MGAQKKKLKTQKKPKNTQRKQINFGFNSAQISRKITVAGIIVTIILVVGSVVIFAFFSPEKVAKRKTEFLVRDYYENYFYEKFISEKSDSETLDELFDSYATTGFGPVSLKNLFLFDNGRDAEYAKYFRESDFRCDEDKTSAIIYPEKPFGRSDYRIEYNFSCENE